MSAGDKKMMTTQLQLPKISLSDDPRTSLFSYGDFDGRDSKKTDLL